MTEAMDHGKGRKRAPQQLDAAAARSKSVLSRDSRPVSSVDRVVSAVTTQSEEISPEKAKRILAKLTVGLHKRPDILITESERNAVEGFLLDKQKGQLAILKRQQAASDQFVDATEHALKSTSERPFDASLKLKGIRVEQNVVWDEEKAFNGNAYCPRLPLEEEAAIRASELIRLREILRADMLALKTEEPELTEDELAVIEAERLAEQARLQELQERYEVERKAREKKIFAFYEGIDEAVVRIASVLNSVNQKDLALSATFASHVNKQIEHARDERRRFRDMYSKQESASESVIALEKTTLSGLDVLQELPPVNFFTEDEQTAVQLSKNAVNELCGTIKMNDLVAQLGEISDWVRTRSKEAAYEESTYFNMLQELQEQEVSMDASNKLVESILQEKEQFAVKKAAEFVEAISDLKEQGSNVKDLIKNGGEGARAKNDELGNEIKLLESQLALTTANLAAVDSELLDLEEEPAFQTENKLVAALEARLKEKTTNIMTQLELIQSK